jgi:uncharacterized membrane protein
MGKLLSLIKREWLMLLVLFVPFLFIAMYWDQLPNRIPMHWNSSGDVNGWAGKEGIFFAPCLNIALALLLNYLPRIDPKYANYALFPKAYHTIRLALAEFMLAIFGMTLCWSLGVQFDINRFVCVGVSLLFLVLGNVMRSFRQNFFAGIRTPWTLSDPVVWDKTHKFSAWVWTGGSLILLIISLTSSSTRTFGSIILYAIVTMALISAGASYIFYRKLHPSK